MDKMSVDYSTISPEELAKLPTYECKGTIHVSDAMGNGCIMDPPGYPTYFTRSLYTSNGNSPNSGPSEVIAIPGQPLRVTRREDWRAGDTRDTVYARYQAKMRRLWNPDAVSEERMMAWIAECYRYFKNCWVNPETGDKRAGEMEIGTRQRPDRLTAKAFKLREFKDDPRFSEEWRTTEREAVRLHNEQTLAAWQRMTADLSNYRPVSYIREWFPDHQPIEAWIDNPPESTGNWWDILPARPTPETCPGEVAWSWQTLWRKPEHPIAKTHCQVCGWHAPKEETANAQA